MREGELEGAMLEIGCRKCKMLEQGLPGEKEVGRAVEIGNKWSGANKISCIFRLTFPGPCDIVSDAGQASGKKLSFEVIHDSKSLLSGYSSVGSTRHQ